MAALEGGVGALATASGQSAITLALLNLAHAGEEIVASPSLYGGTHTLFTATFRKFGIRVRIAATPSVADLAAGITDATRALYVETIGNPTLDVPPLQAVADLAHQHHLPLILDNTFATPYHCRPFQYGADILIHSATKFINGHGTGIGGVIVDSGQFPWANGPFPEFVEPDPTYHGIRYEEAFGPAAYIVKARVQLMRDIGACLSPDNAFSFLQGLETLPLRMARHAANAAAVGAFLSQDPRVEWVRYPGLATHPTHEWARMYLEHGYGALVTFGIRGGLEAGRQFIQRLQLFSHVANVGDAKSLVIHPASTTHRQLSPEAQQAAGVTPAMVRLSVGLEDPADIIADLDQALRP